MQEDMHENNGMTVKQFVDILKKSWVTIVICVLIVAVVFGSFLAIVKVVATDTYYQGTLYFADTSNNESRAADISNLTSADNISKALGDLGYTEEEVAALTGDVRHALSVAPGVPADAQGGETVYVPATYVLTMQPNDDLGDTENQAILNAVMNRFVSTYSKSGTDVAASIVMTTGNYASYDYLHAIGELIDVTTVNLGSVTDVVNKTVSSADQGQHGLFAAVQSRMIGELARLQVLQNTVAVNGVYREGAALSNEAYLKLESSEIAAKVTSLASTIESYKAMIESVASQGGQATAGNGSVIIDNSALFNYLNNTYTKALNELQTATENQTVIDNMKTTYDTAKTAFDAMTAEQKTAMRADVDKELNAYVEALNALFAEVSELFNDYNDYTGSTANSIYVIAPASTLNSSSLSNTVLLLALLIVLVLTVFFAFMHGRKKYMQALEKVQAEAESDDRPAQAEVKPKEEEKE